MLWRTFLRFRSLRRRCSVHDTLQATVILCYPLNLFAQASLNICLFLSRCFRACFSFSRIGACFMSRQSTRARQSTRSCLACETGEIVCFLHQNANLQKYFGAPPQTPTCKAPSFAAGYAPGSVEKTKKFANCKSSLFSIFPYNC